MVETKMCFLRGNIRCSKRFLVINSVFLVCFFLKNGCCDEDRDKRCRSEMSITKNGSFPVYWHSTGIDNEIVLSSPPCTDEFGNLITRVCSNKTWIPANAWEVCSKVTQYGKRCPLQFEETPDGCIFFAAAQPWGNICSLEALTKDYNNTPIKNELLWLPYKRLSKYGPFESLTFGDKLGTPFDKPIKGVIADKDFFNKNCLVVNITSEEYYPEFCYKHHRYICQFSKEEVDAKCPKHCKSADLFSDVCYCKQTQACSQLASVNTMFDYTILSDLADEDECAVNTLSYPNFSIQGFKQLFSHNSWYYTTENVTHSLCVAEKMKYNFIGDAEMVLNFDDKEEKLYLTIYSPQSLYNNASEETIYCYTDAASFAIKKRKEVNKVIENKQISRWYNVYEVDLEKEIGSYYCEAYKSINNVDKITSNTVLAYKSKIGCEFSVRMTISRICLLFNCNQTHFINLKTIIHKSLNSLKDETRVMNIYHFDLVSIDLLLHISIMKHANDILKMFNYIKENLERIQNKQDIYVTYIRSSEYCLPETLNNLSWPLTPLSQSAVSEQKCLQENGLPVVRICGGDFLTGARWSDVLGKCASDVELPESTKYIYSALQQNLTDETINNVTNIIRNDLNLPVLSIYYTSKFLNKIYTDINVSCSSVDTTTNDSCSSVSNTINIIDSLLNINKENLINSQDLLNVTDDLIDLVDDILINTIKDFDTLLVQKENVIIHITNPILSGIYGWVVYQEDGMEPFVTNLSKNSSLYDVGPNALVALLIPEEILTHTNSSNITIITTIYFKDSFFESNNTKKPVGPIVSVTIPEFEAFIPSNIPILFKVTSNSNTPECGFWDYGKKSVRKKGQWSTVGGNYLGKIDNISNYHVCMYSHLTHLSMLRITTEISLSVTDDAIIDVLYIIGDVLTTLGISGIFTTAFLFKRWRKKQGTIILLNLSISILLETFFMQLSDTELFVTIHKCTIFGILLHYFVICKFCWMLVYSFLQYMRFVKVLTILPENIVLKSTIFGWGFAILPVAIVNITDSTTYTKRKYNFCYPVGNQLYFGVLMPIGIIVFVNTFVFFAVMREITSSSVESHGSKEDVPKLQIQLACLLFFVLGVPWMFWVFSNFVYIQWLKLTLIYLFSITSNVQGFILFLFYVLLNKETKQAWINYFCKNKPKLFTASIKTSKTSSKS